MTPLRVARSAVVLATFSLLLAHSAGAKQAPLDPARITLSATNEPVRSVLLRLAKSAGVNIAVGEGLAGYVTVALRNVSVREALDAILRPLGNTYRRRGSVFVIEAGERTDRTAAANAPTVLPLAILSAQRAAAVVRPLFPQALFTVDTRANALVVVGSTADVQVVRTVLQGLDVRNPTAPATEALSLRTVLASRLIPKLRGAFPHAQFSAIGERQLLITAAPAEVPQIKTTVATLDAPPVAGTPAPFSSEAVRVTQREPRVVARALAAQVPGLHAAVAGSAVVLSGSPEAVSRGKALIAQLDLPAFGDRYTQLYRIRSLDAASVADLLRRSFRDIEVTVDAGVNAVAVVATVAQHQRVADALAQLDPPAAQQGANAGFVTDGSTEVVTLRSYVPGQPQTGATDAVASITQALQFVTPDVKVAQLPTPGQIALIGSPPSVRSARAFIEKVDVAPPLVVLDTEVLEVDESVAKNLGLQLGTAALSTTFTELNAPQSADGSQPRLGRFQALTRTPIQFTAQLNLLIQNGKGRVLADPRITTLSGRTASIRAGDTISILTTTAGNAGTIATTQVQSFQTGVTLDITPAVTPDGEIMVNLHPVVNSLIGTNNGVPEISTRDTQTTVHLHDDETLVIGGLIQENDTRTTTKVPLLGDLPLLGRVFRNDNVQGQRNELIIVVTPHIVKPETAAPGPLPKAIPRAQALPTLPPNTRLPSPAGQLPRPPTPRGRALETSSQSTTGLTAPVAPNAPPPNPSASPFGTTNVFIYGSPPQSTFARSGDPVRLFFVTLSPTVVASGTAIHIAAATSSNANTVTLRFGGQTVSLVQSAPGEWQIAFPFPGSAVPIDGSSINAQLTASRSDGMTASIPIVLNATP